MGAPQSCTEATTPTASPLQAEDHRASPRTSKFSSHPARGNREGFLAHLPFTGSRLAGQAGPVQEIKSSEPTRPGQSSSQTRRKRGLNSSGAPGPGKAAAKPQPVSGGEGGKMGKDSLETWRTWSTPPVTGPWGSVLGPFVTPELRFAVPNPRLRGSGTSRCPRAAWVPAPPAL